MQRPDHAYIAMRKNCVDDMAALLNMHMHHKPFAALVRSAVVSAEIAQDYHARYSSHLLTAVVEDATRSAWLLIVICAAPGTIFFLFGCILIGSAAIRQWHYITQLRSVPGTSIAAQAHQQWQILNGPCTFCQTHHS